MITSNNDILAEKKNYAIYCEDCDWFISYFKKTRWYVERQLEFIQSLPNSPTSACRHSLEIKEI